MMHTRYKQLPIPGLFIIAGLAVGCLTIPHGLADDILKPEEAYKYNISAVGDEITVHWRIEPEHYLYKKRMGYASLTETVELGAADLPPGIPHFDEFFGEMEIYRDEAIIRIPVKQRAPGVTQLNLELRSQGCADIGLCYPPQVWTTTVALDIPPTGKLERLMNGGQGSRTETDPLPEELAFQPVVTSVTPFDLQVNWTIADGYYLYRDSIKVLATGEVAQPGRPIIPPGTPKWDEHFGDTQVFYKNLTIDVPLSRASPTAGVLPLILEYQGCKEDSICYPPKSLALNIKLPAATAADLPRDVNFEPEVISEQDRLSAMILNGNLFIVMLTFTGLGLLLAFTPCVLPMVPILSGIIAGQGKDVTTSRAFSLSLTYVLGMALTYTLAGAAFAAMGGQIQAALQKPWIIVGVAALFVALALSMFGLYELQMPAALQTRMSAISNKQRSGTLFGTAVMGILSALIVTTCVAPPLVASMTVIASAGDVTRGALSLFSMSIGMGIPLLVIGTSAGRWLPKAGPWMNAIKGAFGFMLLGLAIWMLERVLPGAITMALWAMLVFMAGIFMGAFQSIDANARPFRKLAKGAGLLATLYGAAILLGALSGSVNPLQPLRFAGGPASQIELPFKRIKTVADLDRELAAASDVGKPVMLDFYADWCVSCKEMEHYTFSDERVQRSLADVVLLQADVTANDTDDQALLQRFDIFGPPTIVFFDASGQERKNFRVVGFMPAADFSAHVLKGTALFTQAAR
jgi:thiol:disulfide interchange protein DsbD